MNGFVGEFLVLVGMFQRAWINPPADSAWQLNDLGVGRIRRRASLVLWLVQRTFFGPLREPARAGDPPVRDLSFREIAALRLWRC
jgi:NADH:ubiquinone oxidoreductase subunit 4 (subunit M)